MAEILPLEITGHRMTAFGVHPISDGRHIVLTFATEDRDTKQPAGEVRFFMTIRGLSMLIAKLQQGARESREMLVKAGAAKELIEELRTGIEALQVIGVWLAPAFATDKVAIEFETEQGPILALALDPPLARRTAELLAGATTAASAGPRN